MLLHTSTGDRRESPFRPGNTWNEWLQLVRSRVEHLNTVIKNHRMFKGEPYRGWVRNLKMFVNISFNGAAAELRARTRRDGDRYPGFGPWPH